MWPENDAHDWSSQEFVTHWTLAKCDKKMMPLVGRLCLTADSDQMLSKLCPSSEDFVMQWAADFDQMWSKLCPLLEDFVTQRTSTKCGPKCAPLWRTLSHCGLRPDVVQILGWEFQFLVPISRTPTGSRIPILFLIPKILDGFF
jgi:hypothetical protein